jgi:hypothetical protein
MRRKGIYAAILVMGIAALFFFWGPWRERSVPDVVQRFAQMQVGQRLHYEVHFGHCFGYGDLVGWIAREPEDWQQAISYSNRKSDGEMLFELEQQLSRDIDFLGQLSVSIYRLGSPGKEAESWVNTIETIRLDWNDDGRWDQEWAQSDRGWSLTGALLRGTEMDF